MCVGETPVWRHWEVHSIEGGGGGGGGGSPRKKVFVHENINRYK